MTMLVSDPLLIEPGCRIWLAVFSPEINDSPSRQHNELSAACLSPTDLSRWQQYRPLEKKRQFLNSRLAVRSVLKQEFGAAASNIFLDAGPGGQPILISADARELPQLSLSHSGPAVAVAISHSRIPIGVDIEQIEPLRASALRLVAVNSQEMASCHRQNSLIDTEFLRTLWTIKESVWKSLGGAGEIMMSDISVGFGDGDRLRPQVTHPLFADEEFSTRLFAMRCEELLPGTMVVKPSEHSIIALRGSVSLRVGRSGRHGCFESAGHRKILAGTPEKPVKRRSHR